MEYKNEIKIRSTGSVSTTCKNCKNEFVIEKDDFSFYEKIKVPIPTCCPLCRKKRRFGHLMRVPKFFKKKCSAPGHTEEVITIYPPSSPHKIYDFDFYQSDNWDPLSYGREVDINKSFLEQFKNFFFEIPHLPLERDPNTVGCEYTLGGRNGKNNYYASMTYGTNDSQYCIDARFCKDVFDCNAINYCELCYETVGSDKCNKCFFVDYSENCVDSYFLYDCKNCFNCYFSYNLRNKSYVFKNEQLNREEYEKRMKNIDFSDRNEIQKQKKDFEQFIKNALRRNVHNINAVNSLGDGLRETKNCFFCFRGSKGEDMKYSDIFLTSKSSMDVLNFVDGENCYESVVIFGSNNKFCMYCRFIESSEYCVECRNCFNCFGCIGLRNKEYHIFNKPFSKDEYLSKINEIKSKMLERGEYGYFFPLEMGLVPYQSSFGQRFFILDQNKAKKLNIPWYDEPSSKLPDAIFVDKNNLPIKIKDVVDDILGKIIICEENGKPFRYTHKELDFYRHMNLPLPSKSPWQRMQERTKRENGIILYPFLCPKCREVSWSIYSEKQQKEYKIFCEKCYLKEIY